MQMAKIKYNTYIKGDAWKEKSSRFLEDNPICGLCKKHKSEEVHHTSYNRLGEEQPKDMLALCKRCHKGIHDLPPYIKDEMQLKKSLKIMEYFRKYPAIKTPVLNEVSSKFYNNEFMLDKAANQGYDTPLFVQNLLEMIHEDGLKRNEDIIEFMYATCIKFRIYASKNTRKKQKEALDRTKKYEKEPVVIIKKTVEKKEISEEDIILSKVKNYCLSLLKDRKALSNAMSYMNNNWYNGRVYFHAIGIKTAEDFYAKILKDNLHFKLFYAMGGTLQMLEED